MKNKSTLVLMEQMIMILVFALAAALCLKAFIQADRLSRETEQQTQATFLAQNAAEIMKSCHGDLDAAAHFLGGKLLGDSIQIRYDRNGIPVTESDTHTFLLQIKNTPGASPAADLGTAEVLVSALGDPLLTLQIVWRTS